MQLDITPPAAAPVALHSQPGSCRLQQRVATHNTSDNPVTERLSCVCESGSTTPSVVYACSSPARSRQVHWRTHGVHPRTCVHTGPGPVRLTGFDVHAGQCLDRSAAEPGGLPNKLSSCTAGGTGQSFVSAICNGSLHPSHVAAGASATMPSCDTACSCSLPGCSSACT
jgi:hypothetical protein